MGLNRREFAVSLLTGMPLVSLGVSRDAIERFLEEDKHSRSNFKVMRRTHPLEPSRELSLLGYGGIRLPTLKKEKPKNFVEGYWQDDRVDFELGSKYITYAYEHGINFFDTGYLYHAGESERLFGQVLSQYPRESYFICDKMPTPHLKSLEQAKEIFEEQLERCKVKYFDNYLLHEIRHESDWNLKYKQWGVLNYLKEEKQCGRIRHLGFSFHGRPQLFLRMLEEENFECVTILLNAIDWEGPNQAKELTRICREKKIPIWVMEPLCGGRLAKLKKEASNILHEHLPDRSDANWSFRFVASKPEVACVLSSFSKLDHLVEDIKVLGADFVPLSEKEEDVYSQAIAAELSGHKLVPCTGCRYCMPCPYGINIADLFQWWNDKVKWGKIPDAHSSELERWQFLREYSIRFPGRTSAYYCIGCKKCKVQCPQFQFSIPTELDRISRIVDEIRQLTHDYPSGGGRILYFLKRKRLI